MRSICRIGRLQTTPTLTPDAPDVPEVPVTSVTRAIARMEAIGAALPVPETDDLSPYIEGLLSDWADGTGTVPGRDRQGRRAGVGRRGADGRCGRARRVRSDHRGAGDRQVAAGPGDGQPGGRPWHPGRYQPGGAAISDRPLPAAH